MITQRRDDPHLNSGLHQRESTLADLRKSVMRVKRFVDSGEFSRRGWEQYAEALADWATSRIVVRKDVYIAYTKDGKPFTAHELLNHELLVRHFRGEITIGLHLISPAGRCLAFAADVDAHGDDADRELNRRRADLAAEMLQEFGLRPLLLDSDGNGGFHVWSFFKKPVAAAVCKWLGDEINRRLGSAGLPVIECFPKQAELTLDAPYGSAIRMPGGKHPRRNHWVSVWYPQEGSFLAGDHSALALIRADGDMPTKLLSKYQECQAKLPKPANGGLPIPRILGDRPSEDQVRHALSHHPNHDLDYDRWLAVGMALNDWDQSRGLTLWLEWSRQSSKFDESETRRKYASFSPGGGITIATLFRAAMDAGWKPADAQRLISRAWAGREKRPGDDENIDLTRQPDEPLTKPDGTWKACQFNTALWLQDPARHMEIRHDSFSHMIAVNRKPLSDELVIGLNSRIEADLRTPWRQDCIRSAIVEIAQRNEFSSLIEWLSSLVWDGVSRIDQFFLLAYGCEPSEYATACGRILFLSAVARAYKPGCQADVTVVLIGPQGIGKSTGIMALVPFPEWFTDDLPDLHDRKPAENLRGKWIVEFAEFTRINRSTNEAVKSFLTRKVDQYRPAYARLAADFPRTCIFVGTTNDDQPLRDTENRRFMPIACKTGNLRWIVDNRDQLWAEAVARYRSGEQWWITDPSLLAEVVVRQEDARQDDTWGQILADKLRHMDIVTMPDALSALGIQISESDRSKQTRIGMNLSKIGFVKGRRGSGKDRESIWTRR